MRNYNASKMTLANKYNPLAIKLLYEGRISCIGTGVFGRLHRRGGKGNTHTAPKRNANGNTNDSTHASANCNTAARKHRLLC